MKPLPITVALLSWLALTPGLHGAAGDVDLSFDAGSSLNNSAYAMVVQPDGKILIGGNFRTVAGAVTRCIARLNPDGTGDPGFNPGSGANDVVRCLALQPDGKVIVGGWFTEIHGSSRNRIARLNADGSLDLTFNPGSGANGFVFAVGLQPDGKILLGGYFTQFNGVNRSYLARLNADGTLDEGFNPAPDYYVYQILRQPDGKLLIGGLFTSMDGVSINRIARLNPNGSLDPSFNPGSGVEYFGVTSMALQADGRVLVGGIFQRVNGARHENIARLNPDGTVDSTFNTAASDQVGSIALQADGRILVAGQFQHLNGIARNHLARLNSDGSLDGSFQPPLVIDTPGVSSLAIEPNGNILASGGFLAVSGLGSRNLVRLEVNGSVSSTLNPSTGINGYGVYSAAVQSNGKIVIGGYFGDVSNHLRQGIARIERDGRLDPTFDPGPILNTAFYSSSNPVVYSVKLTPDEKVIVGGGFTNINGIGRNNIARLNSDGTVDLSFAPGSGADYSVYRTLLQPDGAVLMTGGFGNVAGTPRRGMARLRPDGRLDTLFDPKLGNAGGMALQQDGKILVTSYTVTNGDLRHEVKRLHADGSADPSFSVGTGFDNFVFDVAVQADGKILASGWFSSVNGVSRHGLARLHPDGALDLNFDPGKPTGGYDGAVYAGVFLQPDGRICVSQSFEADNAIWTILSRLESNGSPDDTFTPCTVLGSGGPRAFQPDGQMVISGSFWSVNGKARTHIARLKGAGIRIHTQPESLTNVVGRAATFTVVGSGPPVLHYQWYKDGAPLIDGGRLSGTTTATLTIHHAQFRDGGTYSVLVSNDEESLLSDPANLSVVTPRVARTR